MTPLAFVVLVIASQCWEGVVAHSSDEGSMQHRVNGILGMSIATIIVVIVALVLSILAWWKSGSSIQRQLAYMSVEDQSIVQAVDQTIIAGGTLPIAITNPLPSPGANAPRSVTGTVIPSFVNIVNTYDGTSTFDQNPNDPGELISITTQNSATVPGTTPSNFMDGTMFKTTLAPGKYRVQFEAYVLVGDLLGNLQMQLLPTNGSAPIVSGSLNCTGSVTDVSTYVNFTVKAGQQSYVLQWSYVTTAALNPIAYSGDIPASATTVPAALVPIETGPLVANLKFYIQRMC